MRYLERRVGDRALAEDILQDAFAKIVARPEQAPADEGVVPWFYSTLRSAAIDQFRRRGAAHRAYAAFARELEAHDAPSDDMQNDICACVSPRDGSRSQIFNTATVGLASGVPRSFRPFPITRT